MSSIVCLSASFSTSAVKRNWLLASRSGQCLTKSSCIVYFACCVPGITVPLSSYMAAGGQWTTHRGTFGYWLITEPDNKPPSTLPNTSTNSTPALKKYLCVCCTHYLAVSIASNFDRSPNAWIATSGHWSLQTSKQANLLQNIIGGGQIFPTEWAMLKNMKLKLLVNWFLQSAISMQRWEYI